MRIILTFPLMVHRPSSQPLTTLITLTERISRKHTPFYPCNLCPPILIRAICVHLCNPCYCGGRRVGRHDGTPRRGGDYPMDTTTPKRAFASPTIDIYPLGSITYSLGRFSSFKTHFSQSFPLEGICIIVWGRFTPFKTHFPPEGICIIVLGRFSPLKTHLPQYHLVVCHYAPDCYRIGIVRGRRGDVYGGEGDGATYRGATHSRLTASARTALPLWRRGCRP